MEDRPGYGRVGVATRDISPHQVVLDDQPVALSPTQDSPQACLACYRLLSPSHQERYPAFSLVQLLHYCALIGRELQSVEIFACTERSYYRCS